jgi:hypothetical protein
MQARLLRRYPPFIVVAAVVGIFFIVIPLFNFSPAFFTRSLGQVSLPTDGWTLCEDLGIGPVDGVPGDVQRVGLCHASGWQVEAYCLEPAKPVPPLGSLCSMVNGTDFWCGDEVQQLREFRIAATPQADTPTAAFTSTATASATPTSTLTPSPTTTPPASTSTVTPVQPTPTTPSATATVQPTVFNRPHPGGPGNLGLLLSLLSTAVGVGFIALAVVLRGKNSKPSR